MYPTEPLVRSILGPHEQQICQLIKNAWAKVTALPDRATYDFKRTVATVMHQKTMNEVREVFAGSTSVRLLEGYETIRLLIERRLVVRLKRMNRRGYTRAQPTQATFAFTTPNTPLPFPADQVPNVCTVDVGYVLNPLGTRIDDTCRCSTRGSSALELSGSIHRTKRKRVHHARSDTTDFSGHNHQIAGQAGTQEKRRSRR